MEPKSQRGLAASAMVCCSALLLPALRDRCRLPRRWRRWRWGFPRGPADARVDIEQPTHELPTGSGQPPATASPSSSVAAAQADRAATPRNFPQMERFAASQPSAEQVRLLPNVRSVYNLLACVVASLCMHPSEAQVRLTIGSRQLPTSC